MSRDSKRTRVAIKLDGPEEDTYKIRKHREKSDREVKGMLETPSQNSAER